MDEAGLLALLSSGAESLVDVVLYLMSHTGMALSVSGRTCELADWRYRTYR